MLDDANGKESRRDVLVAGALGALAMTACFLVARAVAGIPTPSELFADSIAPLIPVHLFGIIIGLVGGYTPLKIIGFTSTIFAQIVVGAAAGLILARGGGARVIFGLFVTALFVATMVGFWPGMVTQYDGIPPSRARIENALLYAVAYAIYFGVTVSLANRARTGSPINHSRRRFLAGSIAAGAGIASLGSWVAIFVRASFPYDGKEVIGDDVSVVTPADRFYCVTKNVTDPAIDPARWRLLVDGALPGSTQYDLASLTKREAIDQETTLMCINNPPEGGLMSNAIWRGVPLRSLLGDLSALHDVREVAFHSADNYVDTIPLAKALEPTTLVAWQMNGADLLRKHGAPVRVLVPGWFGEKSVKWLTRIEARRDDRKGFYATQGWGPSFVIPIHSRIDFPAKDARVRAGSAVELHGVAFGGDRGVLRVELSTDAGRSWRSARLQSPYRQLAWRLWSFDWRPPGSGPYTISVRATDGDGRRQSAVAHGAETQGATGLHTIVVNAT